jgi:hypothetical protein
MSLALAVNLGIIIVVTLAAIVLIVGARSPAAQERRRELLRRGGGIRRHQWLIGICGLLVAASGAAQIAAGLTRSLWLAQLFVGGVLLLGAALLPRLYES